MCKVFRRYLCLYLVIISHAATQSAAVRRRMVRPNSTAADTAIGSLPAPAQSRES
jgi:hypothetical protein